MLGTPARVVALPSSCRSRLSGTIASMAGASPSGTTPNRASARARAASACSMAASRARSEKTARISAVAKRSPKNSESSAEKVMAYPPLVRSISAAAGGKFRLSHRGSARQGDFVVGLRPGADFSFAHPRRQLGQPHVARLLVDLEDAEIGDHHVDHAGAGQRQRAAVQKLWLVLGGVLHDDHHLL